MKTPLEVVSMIDDDTEEMIVEADKLKEASVTYLSKLLTNREPKEGFEIDIKIKEILNQKRTKENIKDEIEEITDKDFDELL